jgi:hypothetical protein
MELRDALTDAIGAHGLWKGRLLVLLDKGKSELSVDEIGDSRRCALGQWLHGKEIPVALTTSAAYRQVAALHVAFHEKAAKVAVIALDGRIDVARQMLAAGGEYSRASMELSRALTAWRDSLG